MSSEVLPVRERHRGVLCGTTDGLVAEAVRRLRSAAAAGAPVLAALRPAVEEAVRGALAGTADAVTFLPPPGDRISPAGTAVAPHLAGRPEASRRRAVVVADIGAEYAERDPYGQHSLAVEALATTDALAGDHTCLYDADPHLVAVARLTHPRLVERGVEADNPEYRGPAELRATHPTLAPQDVDAVVVDVTPHTDPLLRRWIADRAHERGMGPRTTDALVLTLHEALRAGAESGIAPTPPTAGTAPVLSTRLYLRSGPGFVCDVDSAALPPMSPRVPPDDHRLRGLWIADAGCPEAAITLHPLDPSRCRIRVSVRGDGTR